MKVDKKKCIQLLYLIIKKKKTDIFKYKFNAFWQIFKLYFSAGKTVLRVLNFCSTHTQVLIILHTIQIFIKLKILFSVITFFFKYIQ